MRRVARRLVSGAPRVPHAPPSGRQPPQTASEWKPSEAPEPEQDEVEDEADDPDLELEATEVAQRLREDPSSIALLDIREPYELRQGHAVGAILVPMNSVPQRLALLPRGTTLAVYCAAGVRSYGVSHWLREQGFEDTWSVPGGLGALASAGVETTYPPTQARPGLVDRVRLDTGEEGWVQRVQAQGDGARLTVLVAGSDGTRLHEVDASTVSMATTPRS